MSLIIGGLAGMLYTTSNVDMMLTTNINRLNQAKYAAQSGINHYMVLRHDSLNEMPSIQETKLTSKASYSVETYSLSQDRVLVVSTGFYKKNNKTLYTYPIRIVVGK